jgi:formylglycine-generating enzyme required for sulfatase activity
MHPAVWPTGKFLGTVGVFLLLSTPLFSQTESEPSATRDDAAPATDQPESGQPERRVQRLGDVVGESEWELEIEVPRSGPNLGEQVRLPDARQHGRLLELLEQLASRPGDAEVLRQLNALLTDIVAQASEAVDANRRSEAQALLEVVEAINPDQAGIPDVRQRLSQLGEVDGQLAAARKAMQAGRVDQPEDNSAWFFYRQALDQAPGNEEAIGGLLAVQQDMIRRALQLAENEEYDSAERLLEDAALVREETDLIDAARTEFEAMKNQQAEALESRAVEAMDAGEFTAAERVLIDLVALGSQGERINQLRRRMEEARIYGGFRPGQIIRDHFLNAGAWAPESVVILAGSFTMGSSAFEDGRSENEGPQHRVTFRRGFAIGQREVSVAEFRLFVSKSGHKTDAERIGRSTVYDQFSGRLTERKGVHWEMDYEGKPAKPDEPVLHVSWNDAQAYANWLARGTGKSYRLPSEAEFEYALRAGSTGRFWWGDGSPPRVVENLTGDGDDSRARRSWSMAFRKYTDRFWGPAPVASFDPNPFGLYDMGGNVGEWVRDCWHDTYIRAPADGTAWVNPGCSQRVIRGGYWASSPDQTRSAFRLFAKPDFHDARIGFRIARDL